MLSKINIVVLAYCHDNLKKNKNPSLLQIPAPNLISVGFNLVSIKNKTNKPKPNEPNPRSNKQNPQTNK